MRRRRPENTTMKPNQHPSRRLPHLALALAACVFLTSGCTTVPRNGALLAAKVGEGIQRNQTETEKVIAALAATQRAILDEEWDNLYVKVETGYMGKNGITEGAALTQDDRNNIAANMSKVWEELSDAIDAKEQELVAQSRVNTAALVEMNETVQRYLLSAEKLDESRTAIVGKLSAITGVDFSGLGGLADSLLDNFNP